PQRSRSWIEDPVDAAVVPRLTVFRVPALQWITAVVTNEEAPAHRIVLRREGMERRHVVVIGKPVHAGIGRIAPGELPRIAARLEEHDGASRFGETRRERPTSRARAHDDVLAARFSGNLNAHARVLPLTLPSPPDGGEGDSRRRAAVRMAQCSRMVEART